MAQRCGRLDAVHEADAVEVEVVVREGGEDVRLMLVVEELGGAEDEGEELVVVEAPDAVGAGGFEPADEVELVAGAVVDAGAVAEGLEEFRNPWFPNLLPPLSTLGFDSTSFSTRASTASIALMTGGSSSSFSRLDSGRSSEASLSDRTKSSSSRRLVEEGQVAGCHDLADRGRVGYRGFVGEREWRGGLRWDRGGAVLSRLAGSRELELLVSKSQRLNAIIHGIFSMVALPAPDIELSPLPQADGSCQYTCPTSRTTVLTAVNGPIEVRAKDEQPNNATVEVIVKPGIGVGGIRETRLSTILQQTLTSLILTSHHPRTLIQITAQILQSEDHTTLSLLLPPLLNCAVFSLLLAGIPLRTTAWTVHLAVVPPPSARHDGDEMQTDEKSTATSIVRNPNKAALSRASSSHVLAFSKEGEMLLVESLECTDGAGGASADGQGWDLDEWFTIMDEAQKLCCEDGVAVIREVLARQKIF
ncbi:LOW QUALITY PROTEIN: hypothetical protein Dda_5763 [Drechslerella dactyloides]|uniref:Exoribonuclease phosphorolytic domain-containing protein n=1 Tax=Drechslerella dactyloides TaxID=74499 RepID=A0AAD6IUK8_DREDA|nr:LOW QUALITY PROTEIN: hypothetical protein Dda_5763 [Drechslerella dactyloides]